MLFSTEWTILTFLAQYIEVALDLKASFHQWSHLVMKTKNIVKEALRLEIFK